MGVIQGTATPMEKDQLIQFANSLNLTQPQKLRLWSHWRSVQKLKKVLYEKSRN